MAGEDAASTTQRFGAHLSIAGGVHRALEAAGALGCDCVQIFVKNRLQWSAAPLNPVDVRRWHELRRRSGVRPVIAHATYLANLASPDPVLWRRSVKAFTEEIGRCAVLRIRQLVIHPGSHRGAGREAGVKRVTRALDEICKKTADSGVRILLETTAGQGHGLGGRFEDLADIIDRAKHPRRLGVCLDTCHLFAAGYELRTPAGYEQTMTALDEQIGLSRVACIHVNDAKHRLGSRADRHEHIGQGKLGLRAFRLLVNDARLAGVPKILETPKGRDARGRDLDEVNLARLRRLVKQAD